MVLRGDPRNVEAPRVAGSSSLADDLHWLLARLKQALGAAEAVAVTRQGMTLWGYTVLVEVVARPAGSQLALSQAVAVDKSKLVAILDELETAGLVSRRPDPTDRRARIVSATAAGRRAFAAARAEVSRVEDEMLRVCDDRERALLMTLLRRLVGGPMFAAGAGSANDTQCG